MLLPYIIEFNAHLDGPEETLCARKYQRMAKLIGIPYSNVPLAVNSLVREDQRNEQAFRNPGKLEKNSISAELM